MSDSDAQVGEAARADSRAAPERPLAPGAVVGDGEQSFRIARALPGGEPLVSGYAAVAEDGAEVWVRAATDRAAEGLLREREILQALDAEHPNRSLLPQIVACFTAGERTCLVTRPVPGETLADQFREGPVPLDDILPTLAQVTAALRLLHAAGWAHLGIRPEAIAPAAADRRATLFDFSYATPLGERPARSFSHDGYSPPELRGSDPVDPRADAYGVGALIFQALQGRPIAEEIPALSQFRMPVPMPGVPQLLERCLGSRETRYETMAALHEQLLRLRRQSRPVVTCDAGVAALRSAGGTVAACVSGRIECDRYRRSWAVLAAGGRAAVDASLRTAATHLATPPESENAENRRQLPDSSDAALVCVAGHHVRATASAEMTLYHIRGGRARPVDGSSLELASGEALLLATAGLPPKVLSQRAPRAIQGTRDLNAAAEAILANAAPRAAGSNGIENAALALLRVDEREPLFAAALVELEREPLAPPEPAPPAAPDFRLPELWAPEPCPPDTRESSEDTGNVGRAVPAPRVTSGGPGGGSGRASSALRETGKTSGGGLGGRTRSVTGSRRVVSGRMLLLATVALLVCGLAAAVTVRLLGRARPRQLAPVPASTKTPRQSKGYHSQRAIRK